MSYDCSWILENMGNVNLYTFDFDRNLPDFFLNLKM